MSFGDKQLDRRALLVKSAIGVGSLSLGAMIGGRGQNALAALASADGRDIKIGGSIPFTGLETHNGLAMKYGIEIGADEINKAGGIAGGKVKLFLEDDQSSVSVAVQKAQKFIVSDHVDLINGTLSSNVRAAVFAVCKKAQMPFMNPTFFEGGLCSPYFFSTGAPPNQTIEPLATYAVKNVGKTFFFIGSDYVWGTGSIKAAKAAVTAAGGKVVGKPLLVPFGTTDFSSEIRTIQAAKPDVIWPFVAGQDGITFLKQLTDAGVRAKVKIVADYIDELIVPALSPEIYTGIVNCSTYFMSINSPANKAFLQAMRSKYGAKAKISSFGMNMYNNMKLLEAAAQNMSSWSRDGVAKNLSHAAFDGPAGRLAFQANSHYAQADVYIAEVKKNGSFNIISTAKGVAPKALCTI